MVESSTRKYPVGSQCCLLCLKGHLYPYGVEWLSLPMACWEVERDLLELQIPWGPGCVSEWLWDSCSSLCCWFSNGKEKLGTCGETNFHNWEGSTSWILMQESLLHHFVLGINQQLLFFLLLARRKEHFNVLFSVPPLGLDCSQNSLSPIFLNLFSAFLNGRRPNWGACCDFTATHSDVIH